jgi:hypothetical protein
VHAQLADPSSFDIAPITHNQPSFFLLPLAEHVWEVDIIRRGLGDSYKIFGSYRVCITDTTLSLVRIGPPTANDGTNRPDKVDFALAHMRR